MSNTAKTETTDNSNAASRRLALREWAFISVALLLLIAGLQWSKTLGTLDQSLYDRFMRLNPHPARDDIIIVAIDDYSLAELGKWPWPRLRHAELIKQLNAANPAAIGLDILFSESENLSPDGLQNGDVSLAAAIAASNKVVLPLVSASAGLGLSAAQPLPILSKAARQLAHIHLELDKDGVARSVFLQEGMHGVWWPHFALAMRDIARPAAAGSQAATLPGLRLPEAERASPQNEAWQRDYQMHIPYYGSSGHFTSVPYVTVLRGEVPADFFRDKYVLIGTSAVGMADSFGTPVSANEGAISGIEINANILASLLDERAISLATFWPSLLYALLPLTLALLGYLFASPRWALSLTAGLFLLLLLSSFSALRLGYWLPPSSALCGLLLAYPLWSWRRLEAAIRYLGEEFILLDQEPHLLPELKTEPAGNIDAGEVSISAPLQDSLEQRIQAMRNAARRVRDLRQFVSDSLNSLPDATIVTTVDGNILLANPAAMLYFASIGQPKIQDAMLPFLFAKMSPPAALEESPNAVFSWWDLIDLKQQSTINKGIEIVDPKERDLLIKSAPCYTGQRELSGWIISLIDISAIRAAERSRDETLHFISHDMRAPQASILALLELQHDPQTALPQADFLNRIEKASRITLALADNFVQLARAEAQDYRLEDMDFQDVLMDASDEMWSLAKEKNIRITTQIPEANYPVRVDRSLMTRVLTNLLSNAIKYSPSDTSITCTLSYESGMSDAHVLCTIVDQGYGIARADQSRLFQRFQRFKHKEQPKNDGVGLGMVFIKKVMDRHHGKIDFQSVPGEGSTFVLKIPAFSV
ncbi:CHASE2 domain-containing protein [Undibacterium parvum]|uniref:histidine kinase n=1 Tax=Undibacterium parvum TaxID=401471 RepID=A0A3S9HKT2_9BURK|nr:CHASE2 domain-containing protein [Undibacterium parvum]AZP12723.1 CHASE2 domain-containing protein [Undibacterium parvum]